MEPASKQAVKNMYRYMIKRIDLQTGKILAITLDCMNKFELTRSLLEKSSEDIKTLRRELKEDHQIADKNS